MTLPIFVPAYAGTKKDEFCRQNNLARRLSTSPPEACHKLLRECLPTAQRVFKAFHIDALVAKPNTFHLQPRPLFFGSLVSKFDLAPGTKHTMPRKEIRWICSQ